MPPQGLAKQVLVWWASKLVLFWHLAKHCCCYSAILFLLWSGGQPLAIEQKKFHYLSDKNDFRIPRQILSRNQNKNLSADWSVGNLRGKTIKTKLIYLDPKSLIFEKSKTFMIYQGEAGCRSNSSGNSRTWEKAALVNDSQTHTHVHCQCLVRHYQVTMVVSARATALATYDPVEAGPQCLKKSLKSSNFRKIQNSEF